MIKADSPLLKPYVGKPAIVDSNLLLLWWCASFDRSLVSTKDWCEHFSAQIQVIPEEWIPAAKVAKGDLMWLGLTDASLGILAQKHVVLTLDFPLSNSLESSGLNVINFTHLRSLWLE